MDKNNYIYILNFIIGIINILFCCVNIILIIIITIQDIPLAPNEQYNINCNNQINFCLHNTPTNTLDINIYNSKNKNVFLAPTICYKLRLFCDECNTNNLTDISNTLIINHLNQILLFNQVQRINITINENYSINNNCVNSQLLIINIISKTFNYSWFKSLILSIFYIFNTIIMLIITYFHIVLFITYYNKIMLNFIKPYLYLLCLILINIELSMKIYYKLNLLSYNYKVLIVCIIKSILFFIYLILTSITSNTFISYNTQVTVTSKFNKQYKIIKIFIFIILLISVTISIIFEFLGHTFMAKYQIIITFKDMQVKFKYYYLLLTLTICTFIIPVIDFILLNYWIIINKEKKYNVIQQN